VDKSLLIHQIIELLLILGLIMTDINFAFSKKEVDIKNKYDNINSYIYISKMSTKKQA